jgi:hypothetical protein
LDIPLANSKLSNHPLPERHPITWREALQWLESRPVQELREMARYRGVSEHATKKTELVAELVGLLTDPDNIRQALNSLSEGEKATLEMVYLLAAHESLRKEPTQKALLSWHGPALAQNVETSLQTLLTRGLLFAEESADQAPRNYRIPRAVSASLGILTKHIAPHPVEQSAAPLSLQETAASTLLQAVARFWQFASAGAASGGAVSGSAATADAASAQRVILHPPTTRLEETAHAARLPDWLADDRELLHADNLYPTVALPPTELAEDSLRALAQELGCRPEMVEFIYHLTLDLGLITRTGNTIQVNPLATDRYLKHGEVQRLQSLTSAWLAMHNWSELSLALRRNPTLRLRQMRDANFGLPDIYADLARLRQFLARLLSLLTEGRWHSFEGLLQIIWQLCPDFACLYPNASSASPKWWIDSPAAKSSPLPPYDWADWRACYEPLFAAFLESSLYWLDSVALAYEGGKLVAFRLTSLGKYLLGRYPQISAARGDLRPMTVEDDLTIKVQLGRVDAEVHDFLAQFADLVDAELDIFRYRISPQRLNQAFEGGLELQMIVSFLERASGAAIPDSAYHLLESYWQGYGSIRLYENQTVIEFSDDYALQELLGSTSLAAQIVYQLSPRLVIIRPEAVEELVAEMVKKGYTPQIKETP